MILFLDLETIPDPSLPPYPPGDDGKERFPPPPYHQVVCAGLLAMRDVSFETVKMDAFVGDELDILTRTTKALRADTTLATFNGRGFDVPVITARAFRHGIDFSWLHSRRGARYRYSDEGHEDIMDQLSDYGAARSAGGLDVWSQLAGFPGKLGADGTHVAEWHASGHHDIIAAYCLSDVVQTAAVALRRWLVAGMSRDVYLGAARSLLSAIEADERVRPIMAKVDVERFLLGEGRVAVAKAEGAAA